MRLIKAWFMTLGMFTIVPVPPVWDDDAKPWVVPLLPLAGFIPGILASGASWLFSRAELNGLLEAVLVLLAWHLASGFIHVDGLMDTSDALFSRASRDKRLAILKDPHVGSFAVIALVAVLLMQLASLESVMNKPFVLWPWLVIPILSRSWASLAVLLTPKVLTEGYASQFRSVLKRRYFLIPLAALVGLPILVSVLAGWSGLILVGVLAVTAGTTWMIVKRSLGGISGDLAGFILVVCETAALLVWAILPEVV
ncbi:MAG: adenosylcobinamide-GDP ribazoletransferase [Clostridia bacterium]|nr:adenosylcobinamide-GDP ribazoletransferase [Clostridia bacterium]NCC76042.1 adenosylcobinamide-GDP ribazoletransferase [Clostridia bacterium]